MMVFVVQAVTVINLANPWRLLKFYVKSLADPGFPVQVGTLIPDAAAFQKICTSKL